MKKIIVSMLLLLLFVKLNAQELSCDGNNYYVREGNRWESIPKYEVKEMMYDNSLFLYNEFKSGLACKGTGTAFLATGLASTITGTILVIITYKNDRYHADLANGLALFNAPMYYSGWSLFGIGLGLTTIGIPLVSVGLRKIDDCVYYYNKREKAANKNDIMLDFTLNGLGGGMILHF